MMTYLSIGANLGNREQNIRQALTEIESRIGTIASQSDIFTTQPWGYQSTHTFLNACVGIETTLSPTALLRTTQAIERQLGRTEKSNGAYHDRIIDIDILLYGNRTIHTSRLHIPHPLMAQRLFVLQPLAQIAANVIVPGSSKSVGEMLNTLQALS